MTKSAAPKIFCQYSVRWMDRYDDDRYALEELRHFEWADECQWFSGDADHCYPFGGVDYDNRFITHPHSQIEAKKALRAFLAAFHRQEHECLDCEGPHKFKYVVTLVRRTACRKCARAPSDSLSRGLCYGCAEDMSAAERSKHGLL